MFESFTQTSNNAFKSFFWPSETSNDVFDTILSYFFHFAMLNAFFSSLYFSSNFCNVWGLLLFKLAVLVVSIVNSSAAIAGAVIGLLLFFFLLRHPGFCYDHMTSQLLICLLFICLLQFHLNCVRDVIFHSQWSKFFLFIRVMKFLVTCD